MLERSCTYSWGWNKLTRKILQIPTAGPCSEPTESTILPRKPFIKEKPEEIMHALQRRALRSTQRKVLSRSQSLVQFVGFVGIVVLLVVCDRVVVRRQE